MRRATCIGGIAACLVLVGSTTGARADVTMVQFHGPHPVDPAVTKKAMCRIEGPHLHAYAPHEPLLYVRVGPVWTFIGDPVEYEADAPHHPYYGHHPVFWVDGPADHYCYITGPHHHWYRPNPTLEFKVKGGVHWYVGAHPSWYNKRRKRFRKIDAYYAGVEIHRPVVHVTPPSGFVGVVVGPGGVAAGAVIAPPSVRVTIPVPSLGIRIGGGGGRVVHHHHYRRGGKVKHKKYKYHGHKRGKRGKRGKGRW